MIMFHFGYLPQLFYKASKEKFDNDAEFKDRAQQAVVRLQVS
jgi:arginyl-tRNA synthetase